MKSEKAPSLEGFSIKCLKKCGMAVRMGSGIVERMFRHGGITYVLALFMYIVPYAKERLTRLVGMW